MHYLSADPKDRVGQDVNDVLAGCPRQTLKVGLFAPLDIRALLSADLAGSTSQASMDLLSAAITQFHQKCRRKSYGKCRTG